MNILLAVLGSYFGLGLPVLFVLGIVTGNARNKIRLAATETQGKLGITGYGVGRRSAIMLTLVALWLFWPVAVYGAMTSPNDNKPKEDGSNGQAGQGTQSKD